MKRLVFTLVCSTIFASLASANSVQEILAKADRYRNPSDTFEMKIQVESKDQTQVFQVYLMGQDKTLVVTKEPTRDKGRNMLMLDREFHAYVPNLKRSMKLSLSQKLNGQVANGDISRTRWAGDYDGKIQNRVDGNIELLLKAQKDNLTYEWIRLWVKDKTFRPLRAEFLALNGTTLLKTAQYSEYKNMLGAERVSSIEITDTSGAKSSIKVLEMKPSKLQENFFTVRNMESLR
ncbi:MAG: outer membrane lipoprotein-sorting protein [Bdellovibrionia bacterium]